MKLGREVSRHNELDNWRNTHRFESVMATKWLLLTISETEPGLWDRLSGDDFVRRMNRIGYVWDHTEGSHMILLHPAGRRLSVPRHLELGRGIMRALIRDAGLTREAFLRLLTQ